MQKKYRKPEEIVSKLRQVDALTSQGITVADAMRNIGVTEATCYRWCKECGELKRIRYAGFERLRSRT